MARWRSIGGASLLLGAALACRHALPAAEPAQQPTRQAAPQRASQSATPAKSEKPVAWYDQPYMPRSPIPPVQPEQVLEWRKKYPLRSLADRLKYEAERVPQTSPPLLKEAEQALAARDGYPLDGNESFRLLHEESVEEFVSRSGFGVGRMAFNPRSEKSLELPKFEPIALSKMPDSAADGPKISLPKTSAARQTATGASRLLPSAEEMRQLHSQGSEQFANPATNGYVKNVEAVAGFTSHKVFRELLAPADMAQTAPDYDGRNGWKRWKISSVQLTSLLKHDTPRVYVSENLPRMEDLSSTRTRELTSFEAAALAKLRAGEELVVEATANRIEMLGALRAAKDCRQCHEVPQGTLLGAFSYDLRRDPPIKETPVAGAVQ